jgi:hypothetical protein
MRLSARLAIVTATAGAAAGALCAGCAAEDAGSGLEPSDVDVVAGNASAGGDDFIAAADGDDAELVAGAQGGFHVWINVRLKGTSGPVYLVHEARRVSDDTLVLRGNRQVMEVPDDAMEDWWESPSAAPAFMCPSPIGIRIYDEEIRFTVEVRDTEDTPLASDEILLVPRCPAVEQHEFCIEICSG